jgi:isoleucyl-tRNA synthetase
LTRLLAPILCFTADEIWENLPGTREASVHLGEFPKVENRDGDEELLKRWDEREMGILFIRSEVQRALEEKRNEKLIGASLEARVTLMVGPNRYELLKHIEDQLPAIFIVSQVELREGVNGELEIKVEHAKGLKCERCWNWSETVGQDPRFPTLDARCVRQIEEGWMGAR